MLQYEQLLICIPTCARVHVSTFGAEHGAEAKVKAKALLLLTDACNELGESHQTPCNSILCEHNVNGEDNYCVPGIVQHPDPESNQHRVGEN